MSAFSPYGDIVLLPDLSLKAESVKLTRQRFQPGKEGAAYDEKWLQKLVTRFPGLLPVASIDAAFGQMIPVCEEFGLNGNFVDNIFVTPTGEIAIVECKLWRNSESRRKVIAQIIDYASDLSSLSYEKFEEGVLNAEWAAEGKSLFEMVCRDMEEDSASFHDRVSRTLREGRFMLIIVGDGIREGLESMTEYLQRHAGLQFNFALIELAIFQLPEGGYVAEPRILGRTTNIMRGVFTLSNGRLQETRTAVSAQSNATSSVSAQSFEEALKSAYPQVAIGVDNLFRALDDAGLAVKRAAKEKTVTLRWLTDSVGWNLGSITSDGMLWMDYHALQARNANLTDESVRYMRALASASVSMQVVQNSKSGYWNLLAMTGAAPRVMDLLTETAIAKWVEAIRQFQIDVQRKDQE